MSYLASKVSLSSITRIRYFSTMSVKDVKPVILEENEPPITIDMNRSSSAGDIGGWYCTCGCPRGRWSKPIYQVCGLTPVLFRIVPSRLKEEYKGREAFTKDCDCWLCCGMIPFWYQAAMCILCPFSLLKRGSLPDCSTFYMSVEQSPEIFAEHVDEHLDSQDSSQLPRPLGEATQFRIDGSDLYAINMNGEKQMCLVCRGCTCCADSC